MSNITNYNVLDSIQSIKDENQRLKCDVSRLQSKLKEEAMINEANETKFKKQEEENKFKIDQMEFKISSLEKKLNDAKEESSNYLLAIRSLKHELESIEEAVNGQGRRKRKMSNEDSPQSVKRQKLLDSNRRKASTGIWSHFRRILRF